MNKECNDIKADHWRMQGSSVLNILSFVSARGMQRSEAAMTTLQWKTEDTTAWCPSVSGYAFFISTTPTLCDWSLPHHTEGSADPLDVAVVVIL